MEISEYKKIYFERCTDVLMGPPKGHRLTNQTVRARHRIIMRWIICSWHAKQRLRITIHHSFGVGRNLKVEYTLPVIVCVAALQFPFECIREINCFALEYTTLGVHRHPLSAPSRVDINQ